MKIYTLDCDPMCGFSVTSHDKEEVMEMSMQHVADKHPDKKVAEEDLEKMVMES